MEEIRLFKCNKGVERKFLNTRYETLKSPNRKLLCELKLRVKGLEFLATKKSNLDTREVVDFSISKLLKVLDCELTSSISYSYFKSFFLKESYRRF